ncbi:type II toxin-antitoxin system YoeB family toxin [Thiohalocapsa halophila]|nr:type II toxin-antitoxin system YoeB family toxin [Thiohalocapsa halophila]
MKECKLRPRRLAQEHRVVYRLAHDRIDFLQARHRS